MRYLVEFERVGRNRNVPSLDFEGTEHELVDAVLAHCSPHLASSAFDVTILMESGTGWIDGGRFGQFTVKEIDGAT